MKLFMKLFSALLFFAFAAALFYSCKKSDKADPGQNAVTDQIRQRFKNEPLRSVQLLNLPGTGFYGDMNGTRLTPGSVKNSRELGTSCPDPGDAEFSQSFVSMEREFTCNVGYRFVVTYKIISEFYIVNNVGSSYSGGRIRLKNALGTYYYITPSASRAPLLSIQNNGVVGHNSLGADLNEFIVSFRTEYISQTDFSNAVAIEPNLFAYTDCSNYSTITIAFSPQQSAEGSQQNTYPCSRVDRVYWNPRNGSTPPNLTGADPVGSTCFPYGYVFPNKQEVLFKNSSNQWVPFYLFNSGVSGASTAKSLINYFDIFYIDVSTSQSSNGLVPGNVQVRFRNNHMGNSSNGGPCVTQPTDTWIYETWYIN
jgi:hypothetical protein